MKPSMAFLDMKRYLEGSGPDPEEYLAWLAQVGERYKEYLSDVRAALPPGLAAFYEQINLHDAWVVSAELHDRDMEVSVAVDGPNWVGEDDLVVRIVYRDVLDFRRVHFDVGEHVGVEIPEDLVGRVHDRWLVDEIRSVSGAAEHHVLFHRAWDTYGMFGVRFGGFDYELRQMSKAKSPPL